jgi:hypothetical protein
MALFYFFWNVFSLGGAIYAVSVTITSFMVWTYWAEARPYALWFLLTTFQIILCYRLINSGKKNYIPTAIIHLLLSLTSLLSVIQIIAAFIVLWQNGCRRIRDMFMVLVVPVVICAYYYLSSIYTQAGQGRFWFADGPINLLSAGIPKDRLFIIIIFTCYLVFFRKTWRKSIAEFKPVVLLLILFWFMFFGFCLLLLKLKLTSSQAYDGGMISNRYFMPLTAAGNIATVFSSVYLVRAVSNSWLRKVVILFLGVLLIFRILKTVPLI